MFNKRQVVETSEPERYGKRFELDEFQAHRLLEQIGDTHELQLSRLPGAKHAALTLVELANVRAPFEWPVVRLGDVASPSGSEAKDVKFAAILSATVKRLMAMRGELQKGTPEGFSEHFWTCKLWT